MSNKLTIVAPLFGALLFAGGFLIAGDPGDAVDAPGETELELQALRERLASLEDSYLDTLGRLAEVEAGLIPAAGAPLNGLASDASPAEIDTAEPTAEPTADPPEPSQGNRDRQMLRRIEQAGLSEDEYSAYESRAYELYLENFEQEWLQRRESFLNGDRLPSSRERLRTELGDDAYDRYLFANGSPNRVRVRRVLPGSAAEQVGLAEGDVLVSYDGERLFDFEDLRAASYRGEPGAMAIMEVRRADGTVGQVSIPRGPMGISGYRGWRESPGG